MIKHHPILFSTPMVQGILEERKTKTRRTKGLEKVNLDPNNCQFESFGTNPTIENDKNLYAYFTIKGSNTWMFFKCPYNVGDVLWVRETWQIRDSRKPKEIYFKASDDMTCAPWKPSLFMPKEACRIFLKIKSIRCERLFDISENDAQKEGVVLDKQFNKYSCYLCETKGHKGNMNSCDDGFFVDARASFFTLWISINGTESFKSNPFVWVYEFERIEKPNDFK
jgi:hypothetical protein